MKRYVLGFAFDKAKETVVLIEKLRPDWQKGKFNGVGGKIEPSDVNPIHAMVREFSEETGLETAVEMWRLFATMKFDDDIMGGKALVFCFMMSSNDIYSCKTVEEEKIHKVLVYDITDYKLMDNLPALIHLALTPNLKLAELEF